MKIHFEVQHSDDGKKWWRFMNRHDSIEGARDEARRFPYMHTRVTKVTTEVVETNSPIPGKKRPPLVLPGIGVIGGI